MVVGAGAAGMGCALAAALAGAEVVLVEKKAELGGTVKHALIHTIGGLFDDQGELLNQGLPAELLERLFQASPYTKKRRIGKVWVLDVDPDVYARTVTDWVTSVAGITVLYQAEVNGFTIDNNTICQVAIDRTGDVLMLQPDVVVDTTGNAGFVRCVDYHLVNPGMALAGYILCLRGIAPDALKFPQGVAVLREVRKAVQQGELPAECATVWLDSGVCPDEVYAKFNISAADYQPAQMQDVTAQLLTYLRQLPGFSQAEIHAYGQLGIRDGGRIRGEYCLTEKDVTTGMQFSDAACQASWPIEHWHPDQGITLEYLPAGQSYTIPMRSMKVAGVTNLWAAGKCLSAEPRAQASARVAGTCWAMGAALGQYLTEHAE